MLVRRDTPHVGSKGYKESGARLLHGSTIKLSEKINMAENIGEYSENYMDDVEHLFLHQPRSYHCLSSEIRTETEVQKLP